MTITKQPALEAWHSPTLIALNEGIRQVHNTAGVGGDTLVASSSVS